MIPKISVAVVLVLVIALGVSSVTHSKEVYPSAAAQAVIDRLEAETAGEMTHDHMHMGMNMNMDMSMSDTNMSTGLNLLGMGGMHMGHTSEVSLSPEDKEVFDKQWSEAEAAALQLNTTDKALAAGYIPPRESEARPLAHFVNWEQVEKPFDPAKPSMLLFTKIDGKDTLIGFSYFVQSVGEEPAGFAGGNDHWHRHGATCVINGKAGPEPKESCKGQYVDLSNFWMLHAWVVPSRHNPNGNFDVDPPFDWVAEAYH